MRPRGTFKLVHRGRRPAGGLDPLLEVLERSQRRSQRIIESLRAEIVEAGAGEHLRIRQVFRTPREIYRLELQLPDLGYQRTTLLDREALEELLAAEGVREVVRTAVGL